MGALGALLTRGDEMDRHSLAAASLGAARLEESDISEPDFLKEVDAARAALRRST